MILFSIFQDPKTFSTISSSISRAYKCCVWVLIDLAIILIFLVFCDLDRMERWVGRVALVTGASSGIGKAIAARFAKHGMKVVASGRKMERLQVIIFITCMSLILVQQSQDISMCKKNKFKTDGHGSGMYNNYC